MTHYIELVYRINFFMGPAFSRGIMKNQMALGFCWGAFVIFISSCGPQMNAINEDAPESNNLSSVESTALATPGSLPEKPVSVATKGAFTKIFDPRGYGQGEPWYINDHTLIQGDD